MTDLLQLAKNAKRAGDKRRVPMDVVFPVCLELRKKGFTFREMHAWLKEQGANVQEKEISFVTAMSRRFKKWTNEESKSL